MTKEEIQALKNIEKKVDKLSNDLFKLNNIIIQFKTDHYGVYSSAYCNRTRLRKILVMLELWEI